MIFGEPAYFAALAATALLFRYLPPRARPWLLAAGGLAFYAYFAGRYWALILVEALLVYAIARWMRSARPVWPAFAAGLVVTIGALATFKYAGLISSVVIQSAGDRAGGLPTFQDIAVPLAISFFTFEFIHYLVDTRRGTIPAHGIGQFLSFAMFAPTMVAGPIKRFQQFVPQVAVAHADPADVSAGITRIICGLFKKTVLADTLTLWLGPLENHAALASASRAQIVVALVAYSGRIYFDFSGYSDIAIGSARLFGIRVPENFAWPYLRASIQSFWRHWHMTLTGWVTDYVYIPLGGDRRGLARTCVNLVAAFAVVGIWHGAAWHFLVWGLYHGVLMVGHRLWTQGVRRPVLARWPDLLEGRRGVVLHYGGSLAGGLLTFSLVTLGWGLFVMPFSRFVFMLGRLT
jgi:alginate O-acetyltransferase complex protein AlgI